VNIRLWGGGGGGQWKKLRKWFNCTLKFLFETELL
jgi:hypothetical protein